MIDTVRLRLATIPVAVAGELLSGRIPPGLGFAIGYPSEFSLETMQLVLDQGTTGPGGPFFIVRKDDDAVIGEIGADLDPATGIAQVGYSLVEPAWGQGYATEALRGLLDDLLARTEVRDVVAETFADHLASRRVLEKAGLVCQGQRTADVDGELRDVVRYATGSASTAGPRSAAGDD